MREKREGRARREGNLSPSRAPRVSLAPKTPFPKRLPRRLPFKSECCSSVIFHSEQALPKRSEQTAGSFFICSGDLPTISKVLHAVTLK